MQIGVFTALLKKFIALISGFTVLMTCVLPNLNSADFFVDVTDERGTVGSIVNTLNVWNPYAFDENTQPDSENDVMSFVDYIELMTATGGNAETDPFVDPLDRTVLDDYDFSRIVASCRGVLNLGAKPFIILGNIPLKLSAEPLIGGFGVNVRPPQDYGEWYRFLRAYLAALTDEFGTDEVKTWRFGVFTEYENDDWFYAGDRDPELSLIEYCKIYDYSVKALTDALGDGVFVGAHSMTVTEGLWDERDFIRHCASGTNYATGEVGTHISYLTSSFYDATIYKKTSGKRPADCVRFLRNAAESYGLYGLEYGFDEGRILSGTAGSEASDLLPRAVGQTVQAAYDAKLYKELAECGASWFLAWGYTSGGAVNGYPSVSYHTASLFSRLAGKTAVGISTASRGVNGAEKNVFGAKDNKNNILYLSAYNYKPSKLYFSPSKMNFTVKDPSLTGKVVEISTYLINDDCNFFDEWEKDAQPYILNRSVSAWSPDSYVLDGNILPEELRERYENDLREKYKECAKLIYTCDYVQVGDTLSFSVTADANSAVFVEIVPKNRFVENR